MVTSAQTGAPMITKPITKAQKYNGKPFEGLPAGETIHARLADKVYYVFDDDSEAYVLTTWEDCAPYQTITLSTMSKKAIKTWKAV